MELNYDWNAFQRVFYPQRRALGQQGAEVVGSAMVLMGPKDAASGSAPSPLVSYTEGEELTELQSIPPSGATQISVEDLDGWLQESLSSPHFQQQLELLRERTVARMRDAWRAAKLVPPRRRLVLGLEAPLFPQRFGRMQ